MAKNDSVLNSGETVLQLMWFERDAAEKTLRIELHLVHRASSAAPANEFSPSNIASGTKKQQGRLRVVELPPVR